MADTLEELWISYNNIEKLKGIGVLKKLKVKSFGYPTITLKNSKGLAS